MQYDEIQFRHIYLSYHYEYIVIFGLQTIPNPTQPNLT